MTRATMAAGGVLTLLIVYLLAFFSVALPALEQLTGATFTRLHLIQFLLVPEVLADVWFGTPPRWALLDRLPIVVIAAMVLLVAAATGRLILDCFDRLRPGRDANSRGLFESVQPLERWVLALAAGLGTWSNYAALLGVLGLIRVTVLLYVPAVIVLAVVAWQRYGTGRARLPRATRPASPTRRAARDDTGVSPAMASRQWRRQWRRQWLWLIVPPAMILLLGGMLPPAHFDVLEYHLQAPKEFFQQGHIGFLPHNVYANMPLGSEMFALLGMAVTGDWFLGGLVGKLLIASTGLIAAAGAYCVGKRLDGPVAGWLAAVLTLNTPWLIDVATAGLAEAPLAMYLIAGVLVLLIARDDSAGSVHWRTASGTLVVGYLAGCAAGCKYPAVVFVALPMLFWVTMRSGPGWHARLRGASLFLLAAVVGGGIWYAKNLWLSGNPFYPLANELFGGASVGWTEAADAQWDAVHRPGTFSLASLAADLRRVLIGSPWLGPLLMPLAGLGVVRAAICWWGASWASSVEGSPSREIANRSCAEGRRPSAALILGGYWLLWIALWWLLTHRIDRFWVPTIPLLGVLGGCAWQLFEQRMWRVGIIGLLTLGCCWSWLAMACPAPGRYPRYFLPIAQARVDPRRVDPWHLHFNRHRPAGKLLLVGEAAVYDLDVPLLYSTCFDHGLLAAAFRDRSAAETAQMLENWGVSHVLVDWGEIGRYRDSYGFPPWITRELFDRLVEAGVLQPLPKIEGSPARAYRFQGARVERGEPAA